MRLTELLIFLSVLFIKCSSPVQTSYNSYEEYPEYSAEDLGITYSPQQTTFKLWSPAVEAAEVHIFQNDLKGETLEVFNLKRTENGVWTHTEKENLENLYYAYRVKIDDNWNPLTADPYSTACGRNGQRSQIIDLKKTNPENWMQDKGPIVASPNDMLIYEIHIRDMSIHPASGIKNKGKYLGLTEENTSTPDGTPTGIAHLKELGVTHVHLLPSFDFQSIDETKPESERNYNWGYDPYLYNVPEGSYSTNPEQGGVRIREYKQMVKALHDAGIGVILDVVYNHTGSTENSVFNQLVPNYYYRQNETGGFSDASACGNETASERAMVRNFIVQSVEYWAKEYHLDGFRFDLMGIHDIKTMNILTQSLHKINPNIFVYGEGWTAGGSPLPDSLRALKHNVPQLESVAAFSDEIRDGIKGHVFTHDAKAFISGEPNLVESVKFGIIGGTQHPQLNYKEVNYTDFPWSLRPSQCVVYASCHDNHTIWDRLINSIPEASEAQREKMQQLALGIVLSSQGVPFLHAGSEFCRTKQGVENSYKSPDSINQIDWNRVSEYSETVDFVKNMIALRKSHPAFRMRTSEDIQKNLVFSDFEKDNLIAYQINGSAVDDTWKSIFVILNGNLNAENVALPSGNWKVVVNGNVVNPSGISTIRGNKVSAPANGMMILVSDEI